MEKRNPSGPVVAIALTQPPLPEGGAPGKCAIGLLRGLVAHGVDVRAVAARQSFSAHGEPAHDLPVELVDVPPEPRGSRARAAAYRQPRSELGRGPFAARFREVARDANLAHLEEPEAAPAGRGLAIPTILHVQYLARMDRNLGPPWSRQFREVALFDRAERTAIAQAGYLVAGSPLVADALRRQTGRDVLVAPLSLDPALYPAAPLDGPPLVGIIGTAAWPGTGSAMRRLARRVWPLVRREAPEARLLLAGRGTTGLTDLAGEPGVELVGGAVGQRMAAQPVRPALPNRPGSGVKVKVLESIASGLPVVTTPIGAEGIEAGDGIVIENDDEALARAAAEILLDATARRDRGAAGRDAFLARYAPEPATAELVELYLRVHE